MANTQYVTENRLSLEASHSRKRVLQYGIPIVLILSFMSPGIAWWLIIALIIVWLNAGSIKRAGAVGEDRTLDTLMTLPDSYTVINQLCIPNKKSRTGFTELDFVVLGPNGIFVIEVKNNNSKIVGLEQDREWVIHKVGRKGTPYTAKMRNPIKQVKGQVWTLSNFIKERGHNTWIEGVVFFSNPESELALQGGSSVNVIHKSGLVDYITRYSPKYPPRNLDKVIKDLAEIKPNQSESKPNTSAV